MAKSKIIFTQKHIASLLTETTKTTEPLGPNLATGDSELTKAVENRVA